MAINKSDFFREITLRISSSLDITKALQNTFDYLADFIPIDTLGLHRVELEQGRIFAVAEITRDGLVAPVQDQHAVFPIDAETKAMIHEARISNRVITRFNRAADNLPHSVLQCFPHLANRSMLTLHLMINNEPIGGLFLSKVGHGHYTQAHADLLESVKEPIALAMSNAWRFREMTRLRDLLAEDNRALSLDLQQATGVHVIGSDFGLTHVMEMVRRVAPISSPVLLLGETGTGKEVIANAIHHSSPRSSAPMVRVPCGAIPETLLDSELFGHEKGAFTGATERKRGRFERAQGGTIFLDEVGELSPEAQVKLLRVLQERHFERIGSSETLTTDARVIAATHRDLASMVRAGTFREDLWYRLSVFPIMIPPLRMRRGDIPALANHFVERKVREMNLGHIPAIPPHVVTRLQDYDWPGNVRELQNVIERALILSGSDTLDIPPLRSVTDSGSEPTQQTANAFTPLTFDEAAAEHIRRTLAATHGRVGGPGGAAERLALNPSTLRFKMKKLGITITRSIQTSDPHNGNV